MERIFVGLGSNTEQAPLHVEKARMALEELPMLAFVQASSVYCTEPQGFSAQPWFHNCVLEFRLVGESTPCELVEAFLAIEARLGRVRLQNAPRFGPRVIDIDLLVFGERVSRDPFCCVPHPRMCERAFVLVPLHEIAPDLVLAGKPVAAYLNKLIYHLEGKKIFQPVS